MELNLGQFLWWILILAQLAMGAFILMIGLSWKPEKITMEHIFPLLIAWLLLHNLGVMFGHLFMTLDVGSPTDLIVVSITGMLGAVMMIWAILKFAHNPNQAFIAFGIFCIALPSMFAYLAI